jgi:pheromone shutdown protein TraB
MWNPSTSLGAGRKTGARVIGVTMAASLVFGLVNHFMIAGADRVDHVVMEWRMMFGTTAALLAVIEAAGAWLGFAYGRSTRTGPTYAGPAARRSA